MHRIDHFCIGSRHIYEGHERLREETGLDSYDSGWFPGMGVGQRIVPIGKHCYIEIESVIDHDMALNHFFGTWFENVLADAGREDRFMGWVVAVDTLEELQTTAERLGQSVSAKIGDSSAAVKAWGRRRPNGKTHSAQLVPDVRNHTWPHGLPMYIWFSDEDNDHPDTIPEAATVQHRRQPQGINWVEVGDEKLTREFLGPEGDQMDIRYVDGPAGLYAVGIATDDGEEIVIRRKPVPLALAATFKP